MKINNPYHLVRNLVWTLYRFAELEAMLEHFLSYDNINTPIQEGYANAKFIIYNLIYKNITTKEECIKIARDLHDEFVNPNEDETYITDKALMIVERIIDDGYDYQYIERFENKEPLRDYRNDLGVYK